MLTRKEIYWFYGLSALFLIIELFFIYNEIYPALALPLVLLFLFLAFYRLDIFYLSIVFLTPLSVPLQNFYPQLSFNLSIPSEPLLILLLFILLYWFAIKNPPDKVFLFHPLTIAIIIYLAWMLVSAVTSTMPLVSLKFFLSHVWFIAGAYFFAYEIFKHQKNIPRFLWLYMIPLTLVILYTFYNQIQTGLVNQKAAHSAMKPFYNDHTAYGAILSMFIPVLGGMFFIKKDIRLSPNLVNFFLFLLFLTALVFSYCRAAWLSLVLATGVFVLVKLRVRFITIALFAIILAGMGISYRTMVLQKLERNKQESSTSFARHISSIANIQTDASNMERINRWKCALRMFAEKPVMGWGPGTYMFQYAPFQNSKDRTIISTDFGDMGNAHSEYLGPLAESGLPGMLSVLGVFIVAFITGLRVYANAREKWVSTLSLSLLTGLTTYLIHGFMNNFLDTDKAAIPFWGFLALLVVLDIRYTSPIQIPQHPE